MLGPSGDGEVWLPPFVYLQWPGLSDMVDFYICSPSSQIYLSTHSLTTPLPSTFTSLKQVTNTLDETRDNRYLMNRLTSRLPGCLSLRCKITHGFYFFLPSLFFSLLPYHPKGRGCILKILVCAFWETLCTSLLSFFLLLKTKLEISRVETIVKRH